MPGRASTSGDGPVRPTDERVASLRAALALVDPASPAAAAYRAAIARTEANAGLERRAIELAGKYVPLNPR
jgi:hypothetical protein